MAHHPGATEGALHDRFGGGSGFLASLGNSQRSWGDKTRQYVLAHPLWFDSAYHPPSQVLAHRGATTLQGAHRESKEAAKAFGLQGLLV